MKRLLSGLIILLFLFFVGITLYVFEIPPFNPGGPFIAETTETAPAENSDQVTDPSQLPEFLQETDPAANKTYADHLERGQLLAGNGYIALSIAEYEAASKLQPTTPTPLIAISRLHIEQQDYIKAKLAAQAAIELSPNNTQAHTILVQTLIADRKPEEAKAAVDAIPLHNQESKLYQAVLTAYTGDHAQAKNLLNESISIGGDTNLSAAAQNYLSAYAEFDTNQAGADIHLRTLLARAAVNSEQYHLAISYLFNVIREKKDYRDAWILLGYAYLNTEMYQDAVDSLDEARKLDSQKPETSFLLGLGYMGLGNLNQAANYLELAKENGYQPSVHVDQKLAEIYLQLQNYESAAESYENVLNLNDQEIGYFIKPVWLYIDKLNKPDKALALANKAYEAHPQNAMSYNLLGWASTSSEQYDKAEEYLNQAKEIDPNLDAVYLNIGILQEKTNRRDQAIQNYKKAFELGGGNSIASLAAENYNRLNNNLTGTPDQENQPNEPTE